MAQSYVDVDGTLYIPGAPVEWSVAPSASGTAATGVVVLVGEATSGPCYSEEDVTKTSKFGPTSRAQVLAKYGSGRLVEAFLMCTSPSKDADIKGAPQSIYLIKTNKSTAASATLGSGSYGKLNAKSAGILGNLIQVSTGGLVNGAVKVTVARKADNISESWTIGGKTAMTLMSTGTTPTATISTSRVLTSGGTPTVALNIALSQFKTINDLVAYINTQTTATATGTATCTSSIASNVVTVNGVAFTAVVSGAVGNQWNIGDGTNGAATNLAAAINGSLSPAIAGVVTASSTGSSGIVTITAVQPGPGANAITLTKQGGQVAVSGATLTGGLGWVASVGTGSGQLSPAAALDCVSGVSVATASIIKRDSYDFITALNSSRLVSVDATTFPTLGLPAAGTSTFLSGGLRGSTADLDVVNALVQAQRIKSNFTVPLFSQDSTGDITAGYTDSGSTYTIAGVNANVASYIALCRQFKVRKPRQAFCSIRDTYVNAKAAAQLQASHAVSMSFMEIQTTNSSGSVAWFQPWSSAVIAAAMQAAAGYKTIFNKVLNITGVRSPMGDFIVEDQPSQEDALQNGLLILAPRDSDGALNFVSDQTTYGADTNFVLNSIQAVYCADTMSMTVATAMEQAFKGQNIADVSAGVAMSFLKSVLGKCKRQKLIAASDDAPTGYKNLSISIQPPAMLVSGEVKPATGLYFIPLKFLLTQPTQTAQG